MGIALLVFSRFALAMPALILGDYPVGKAIFRSDELTERKWLVLAVLLLKSLVGGYIAGMLPSGSPGSSPGTFPCPRRSMDSNHRLGYWSHPH